jgi:uncharacterized membrane protein YfcA
MIVLGYLAALVMGTVLGLVGGGGSILTVPILVYLLGVGPKAATAYSLFVVGTSSIFGAWTYARRQLVDFRTGVIFAIPAFVGVYSVRKYLMPSLPPIIFSVGTYQVSQSMFILLAFAIVMVLAAISMIYKKTPSVEPAKPSGKAKSLNYPLVGIEGIVVGAITGFVGAGGGFLIIPALVVLAGLEMKVAVGTSLVIIAAKSLVGFVGDLQTTESMDWPLLIIFTAISVVGIFIGTALSSKVPNEKLKPAFGWFVLIMGAVILIRELVAH